MELDKDTLIEMYRKMLQIRHFEEGIWYVYTHGLMSGLAHLYIGEEAVAVGACFTLRDDDYITSTHRGHGHCIAKGGQLDRMMAEVMGKRDGYCKGKGGSMHIADLSIGILGANGIVAGGFGIATGAAFSAKRKGTDQVAVCFFGDGAVNQGIMLETMNLASIWKLPVVFICENNQYGEYTAAKDVTSCQNIADKAAATDIPGVMIDGNDVIVVYETVKEAVERARKGEGATLIECQTYRWGGHHVGDPGAYRSDEELAEWKAKDPIKRFSDKLLSDKLATENELEAIEEQVKKEIEDAIEFGKNSPFPSPEEVEEDVYA